MYEKILNSVALTIRKKLIEHDQEDSTLPKPNISIYKSLNESGINVDTTDNKPYIIIGLSELSNSPTTYYNNICSVTVNIYYFDNTNAKLNEYTVSSADKIIKFQSFLNKIFTRNIKVSEDIYLDISNKKGNILSDKVGNFLLFELDIEFISDEVEHEVFDIVKDIKVSD